MNDARDRKDVLAIVVKMNDWQRGTANRLRKPHNYWPHLGTESPSRVDGWPSSTTQAQPMGPGEWESVRGRLEEVARLAHEAIVHIDRLMIEEAEGRRG